MIDIFIFDIGEINWFWCLMKIVRNGKIYWVKACRNKKILCRKSSFLPAYKYINLSISIYKIRTNRKPMKTTKTCLFEKMFWLTLYTRAVSSPKMIILGSCVWWESCMTSATKHSKAATTKCFKVWSRNDNPR